MRINDALKSLQLGKKEQRTARELTTVWSEQADDGPEAVPLPEYPRPQLVRENWVCLNGWWDYGICPAGKAGKASRGEAEGKILVPFSPETRRSGVGRTLQPGETLWYRRRIGGLELPEGKRLILHFGAVDERCAVYWNDKKVGIHRNGYLSFSLDVTEFVEPGNNELKVFVRDDSDQSNECCGKQTLCPGGMYYHAQSGIWQTVWMETVPENYLEKLRITPLPEKEEVLLDMTFAGEPAGEKEIQVFIRETGLKLSFPLTGHVKARVPVPEPRLWSPEDPELYSLYIRAGEDSVESYFAMRSWGTGTDADGKPRLLLNGEPYYFNGVLDQGYWPESLMTPPSDEALIYDIEQMKEIGFNMLRKHVKIESARWYYHCDRIGMAVWQDMINGGGPIPKMLETYLPTIFPSVGTLLKDTNYKLFHREDEGARKRFERDLMRMIRQLYNHPCIAAWVPFNEGWGQFDSLRLTYRIKKEDSGRLVDHASGWFDQGGGDMRSVHNYFRPLKVEEDSRAFVISEYGGISCPIEDHSMNLDVYGYQNVPAEQIRQAFEEAVGKAGALVEDGLCASVYTQVSDIEEETNGLLTYDRKVRKVSGSQGLG